MILGIAVADVGYWCVGHGNWNLYEKQRAADGTIQDSYCQIQVESKVQKVREKFADKTKASQ